MIRNPGRVGGEASGSGSSVSDLRSVSPCFRQFCTSGCRKKLVSCRDKLPHKSVKKFVCKSLCIVPSVRTPGISKMP